LFDRYENRFRGFVLNQGHYEPIDIVDQKVWITDLDLGLGVWHGMYQGITRNWLRWYDSAGAWVPTPQESAEQERQRAEQAEDQVLQIARNLAVTGMSVAQIAEVTGLTVEQLHSVLQ
jgi:hypothetical protein